MNLHDFNDDPANLPADVHIQYPRTIDDEVAETITAIQNEDNLAGLARHEPTQTAREYGSREPVVTMPKHQRTEEDLVAELHADLADDVQWRAFVVGPAQKAVGLARIARHKK